MESQTTYPFSLYIGDLPANCKTDDLNKIIVPLASQINCRVLNKDNRSYGYVNFQSEEDAKKIINELNYTVQFPSDDPSKQPKPIRIMWKKEKFRESIKSENGVFLTKLPKDIQERYLYDFLSSIGPSLESIFIVRKDNECVGVGYGQFKEAADATKVIEEVEHKELKPGVKISAIKYLKKEDRNNFKLWKTLYVKNFPEMWDDQKLAEFFSKGEYEKVASSAKTFSRVDDKTRTFGAEKSKPFGFISFKLHEDAEKALSEFQNKTIIEDGEEYTIYVAKFKSKQDREKEKQDSLKTFKLQKTIEQIGKVAFISKLPDYVNEDHVKTLFQDCGEIMKITLGTNIDNVRNGTAHVIFKEKEGLQNALKLNGYNLVDRNIEVVEAKKKSIRREEKQQKLNISKTPQEPTPIQVQQHIEQPYPKNQPRIRMDNFRRPPQMIPVKGRTQQQFMPPMYQEQQQIQRQPQQQQPQRIVPQTQSIPTLDSLKNETDEKKKEIMGEILYAKIKNSIYAQQAGKLTGMLLEMDIEDCYEVATKEDTFITTLEQASQVLSKHTQPTNDQK